MKQSSAREMVLHAPQLTQRIKGLRQELLKDYEGKSTQGDKLLEGETPFTKLAKLTDDTTKLRQELLSSQMLNSAQVNAIRQLKLQIKMKEQENVLLEEKQVNDGAGHLEPWMIHGEVGLSSIGEEAVPLSNHFMVT